MDIVVALVFGFVYLGMIVGRIPPFALDRTGFAVLGAIVLVAAGRMTTGQAAGALHMPTLALLFGLLIVSAQLRLGGFYTVLARKIASAGVRPPVLLGLLIAAAGGLSAILANDIVCLAMTPVLIEGCGRRKLNPIPFLLALACASNVGSAATLIGNPQNMLIGQVLQLSFVDYLWQGGIPACLGLIVVWVVIAWQFRGRFAASAPAAEIEAPAFNAWQSAKGLVVAGVLMAAFVFSPWPREVVALAGAGVLLMSRRMATRKMLGNVDWHLLALFAGLFVVNQAVANAGLLDQAWAGLTRSGVDVGQPTGLFLTTVVLSNLVSNVPAVMLLLPHGGHPLGGPILALASTLAGNLFLVGSIANLIVVDQAGQLGVKISWASHARTGIPVTLGTLAVAAAWLWWLAAPAQGL